MALVSLNSFDQTDESIIEKTNMDARIGRVTDKRTLTRIQFFHSLSTIMKKKKIIMKYRFVERYKLKCGKRGEMHRA